MWRQDADPGTGPQPLAYWTMRGTLLGMNKILIALLLAIPFALVTEPARAVVAVKQITIKDPRDHLFVEAYKGYSVVVPPTTMAGTSETVLLYLKNGSSNSYVAKILQKMFAVTTAGHTGTYNLYLNPTCSANGTPLTIANLHGNAAPAVTTLTAFITPTCSANGTLLDSINVANPSQYSYLPIYLDPGNNLLVTVAVSNASDKAFVELFWAED